MNAKRRADAQANAAGGRSLFRRPSNEPCFFQTSRRRCWSLGDSGAELAGIASVSGSLPPQTFGGRLAAGAPSIGGDASATSQATTR